MKKETAAEILTAFNNWRRGAEIPQPDPTEIGQAIDAAIEALKSPKGDANDFEVKLYALINQHCKAGLKKPELIDKMKYVLRSCEVS